MSRTSNAPTSGVALVNRASAGMDEPTARAVLAADCEAFGTHRRAPQRRYTAGSVAKRVGRLRRFVPAGVFDKSLRKQLGP